MGTTKATKSETPMYHLSRPFVSCARLIGSRLTQMYRVERETDGKHQIDRYAGDEVVHAGRQPLSLLYTHANSRAHRRSLPVHDDLASGRAGIHCVLPSALSVIQLVDQQVRTSSGSRRI